MRILVYLLSGITLMYVGFLMEVNSRIDAAIVLFFIIFIGLFLLAIFYEQAKAVLLKNRWFIKVTILVIVIFVMTIGTMEYKMSHANGDVPHNIEYVVVLGAGLKNGEVSLALKERLDIAITYAKRNDVKIIVSGGVGIGEENSEAYVMEKYLLKNGIKKKRIIKEEKATSTYENLLFTKRMLEERDKKGSYKIAIITNDFHLYRSIMIAKRLGYEAYGLPAETPREIFVQTHVREYMAIVKSWIMDR